MKRNFNIYFATPKNPSGKELPWSKDKHKFEQWAHGRTGVPFVDANMRELKVVTDAKYEPAFFMICF
jgi:deoxyribodipyrimidine photolyase